MELHKYNKKTKNLLDKSLLKDINSIANVLIQDYDIYNKNNDKQKITHNEIFEKIQNLFKPPIQVINICCGITKSNTRCTRQPIENYKYCKSHVYQAIILSQDESEIIDTTLEKIYIKDQKYYINKKYIYDTNKQSKSKVGYIKNKEFILTDDPFLLGEFE